MRKPWTPMSQASGSLRGVGSKCVRRVTATWREGRREAGMGEKRVSSKALVVRMLARWDFREM